MATRKKKYSVNWLHEHNIKMKASENSEVFYCETEEVLDDDGDSTGEYRTVLSWIDKHSGDARATTYDANTVADYLNNGTWTEVPIDTPMGKKVPTGNKTQLEELVYGELWNPMFRVKR